MGRAGGRDAAGHRLVLGRAPAGGRGAGGWSAGEPVGWDPFFTDRMSVAEVYHYGTLHFDYHRRQLTLDEAGG